MLKNLIFPHQILNKVLLDLNLQEIDPRNIKKMEKLNNLIFQIKKFTNIILFSKKLDINLLKNSKKSIVLDKKNLRSENLKFKNSFLLCTR